MLGGCEDERPQLWPFGWGKDGKMMMNLWDSKDGCWILMMIYYFLDFPASYSHFDGENDDL